VCFVVFTNKIVVGCKVREMWSATMPLANPGGSYSPFFGQYAVNDCLNLEPYLPSSVFKVQACKMPYPMSCSCLH